MTKPHEIYVPDPKHSTTRHLDVEIAAAKKEYQRTLPERSCRDGMFETRTATQWVGGRERHAADEFLYGNLWRPGELAVLFGETGVGKSIFATQIAETVARGVKPPCARRKKPGKRVLYFDLESGPEQFRERYTCPRGVLGEKPAHYTFHAKHERANFRKDFKIPREFAGNFRRFFEHSVKLRFEQSDANIYIVDNLSGLDPENSGGTASLKWLRTFKLWTAINGVSVLVLTHAKPRKRLAPTTLKDIALGHKVAEIADTVFAICRSNFGQGFRYVKMLKSRSQTYEAPADEVQVYQIERSVSPFPPAITANNGSPNITKLLTPIDPAAVTVPFPLSPSLPDASAPFLGMAHLGVSTESVHLRDYETEFREAERREAALLKKARSTTTREVLVQGYLNGRYNDYLNS